MDRSFFIFTVTILLIFIQLLSFYFKLKQGKSVFYLISICSLFFGGVFYLYYGIPLDEGTAAEEDIPVLERNFTTSAVLLLSSVFTLAIIFLRKMDRR